MEYGLNSKRLCEISLVERCCCCCCCCCCYCHDLNYIVATEWNTEFRINVGCRFCWHQCRGRNSRKKLTASSNSFYKLNHLDVTLWKICSTYLECYYIHLQEPATVCRYIVLFLCVQVYWCGSVEIGCYPNATWSTTVVLHVAFG